MVFQRQLLRCSMVAASRLAPRLSLCPSPAQTAQKFALKQQQFSAMHVARASVCQSRAAQTTVRPRCRRRAVVIVCRQIVTMDPSVESVSALRRRKPVRIAHRSTGRRTLAQRSARRPALQHFGSAMTLLAARSVQHRRRWRAKTQMAKRPRSWLLWAMMRATLSSP